MGNRNTKAANLYHESTKRTYIDLSTKPPLYKSYPGDPTVPLPIDFGPPASPALLAVAGESVSGLNVHHQAGTLELTSLALLLHFSAGVIRRGVLPRSGEVHYRAAASAGALYPVEVYLVAGEMPGLKSGVYHFSPADASLTLLREGDHRGELVDAAGGEERVAAAPVTLVLSAVFWRSSWKYGERGYRYCHWDAGTVLSNALAVGRATDLPIGLVTGFHDGRVNRLLGLTPKREAALCLVPVGSGIGPPAAVSPSDAPLLAAQVHYGAGTETSYPAIVQAHASTCLTSSAEVLAWRRAETDLALSATVEASEPPGLLEGRSDTGAIRSDALGSTILNRGSTRRFERDAIAYDQFAAILGASTRRIPADFGGQGTGMLLEAYIIANAVEGLETGAYFFSPTERKLELVKQGDFRDEAGHLCFEQALGADCSAVIYFLASLDQVLGRYGNRGYRAAQLEAGVRIGNVYLCAHSMGLGATGMTFYDDEVVEFFSPHAEGKSVMSLAAIGVPHAQNRVRPFRSRTAVRIDSLARGAGQVRSGQDDITRGLEGGDADV